jgi:hypothetical protein
VVARRRLPTSGYFGQSVDELLTFEVTSGAHLVLGALEQAIQAKQKEQGPMKMTGIELTVLSVMALLREVNNGRYHQFFVNSSKQFGGRIVRDLVRIGCTEIADITQAALDAVGVADLSVSAIGGRSRWTTRFAIASWNAATA